MELEATQRPTIIYQDNVGSIDWSEDGQSRHFGPHKHIDIWYSFVLNMAEDESIRFLKVNTTDMLEHF